MRHLGAISLLGDQFILYDINARLLEFKDRYTPLWDNGR